MDYFSKLPNRLFLKSGDGESYLKIINNDKVLLVLDYLYINTNRKNESLFIIEDIVVTYGYKPNGNKGRINDQIHNILIQLRDMDLIKTNIDIKKITHKQLVRCILNIDFPNKFMMLYESEKNIILNQTNVKLDNLKLLMYYCYLKTRMYKRSEGTELYRDTEMAEACYPSFEKIYNDLGLSNESVMKYNKLLRELKLIEYANAGKFYHRKDKSKTKRETPNFYVLHKEGWEEELDSAIKHYKKQNKDTMIFTDEPYKNNDRKVNGFIGRIEYLESIGKATEKQIKQKNELINLRKIKTGENDRVFTVQSLFETYKGMLVSEIYEEKGQVNNAEREYELEFKLKLIDEDRNLLIDYDYYKWVMANYKKEDHDYYLNCVKSHKNT